MKYVLLICCIFIFACTTKTVQTSEYPEGVVIVKEMQSTYTYEVVIQTPQGLQRIEIDEDFYNYINNGDTIVRPY